VHGPEHEGAPPVPGLRQQAQHARPVGRLGRTVQLHGHQPVPPRQPVSELTQAGASGDGDGGRIRLLQRKALGRLQGRIAVIQRTLQAIPQEAPPDRGLAGITR